MKTENNRSKYFLIELTVNCLFFTIAAAVCIGLFIYGTVLSKQSTDLSHSALISQTIAETFKASDGDIEKFKTLTNSELSNDTLYLYYDISWQRTETAVEQGYIVKTVVTHDNNMSYADIEVIAEIGVIYMLSVANFFEKG